MLYEYIYVYIYDIYKYIPSSPSSVGLVGQVPRLGRSGPMVVWGGGGGSIYGYIHGPGPLLPVAPRVGA